MKAIVAPINENEQTSREEKPGPKWMQNNRQLFV
jgi:hypothetical protein